MRQPLLFSRNWWAFTLPCKHLITGISGINVRRKRVLAAALRCGASPARRGFGALSGGVRCLSGLRTAATPRLAALAHGVSLDLLGKAVGLRRSWVVCS